MSNVGAFVNCLEQAGYILLVGELEKKLPTPLGKNFNTFFLYFSISSKK